MASSHLPRPAFDPAYKAGGGLPGLGDILDVHAFRKLSDTNTASDVLDKHKHLAHTDITIPAVAGLAKNSITIAVFQAKDSRDNNRPAVIYVHGGGQVVGNRFHGLEYVLGPVCPVDDDIVFVSVEYRRAPEDRAPAGAHDCYAALVYLADNAEKLRIDPSRIMVYGISGGGPLAAATCLLSRNRKGPHVCAQLLNIPMLDDRDHWLSHKQFETGTLWEGNINRQAWDMILGPDKGGPNVDEIQCPGRATDLSGLPPAYIDVGECEVFRDGAVAFASQIWKAGGSAELHVWPGVYHGAILFEPDVPISQAAMNAQRNFIERALGLSRGSSGRVRDISQAAL